MYLLVLSLVLRWSHADEVECLDTPDWKFTHGKESYTCTHFATSNVCADSECKQTEMGQLCGDYFNNPEKHCCACGKATAQKEPNDNGSSESAPSPESTSTGALERIKAKIEELKNGDDAKDAAAIGRDLNSLLEKTEHGIDKASDDALLKAQNMIDQVWENADAEASASSKDVSDLEPAVGGAGGSAEVAFADEVAPSGSRWLYYAMIALAIVATVFACSYYGLWSMIYYPKQRVEGYRKIPAQRNSFYHSNVESSPQDLISWSYGSTSTKMAA